MNTIDIPNKKDPKTCEHRRWDARFDMCDDCGMTWSEWITASTKALEEEWSQRFDPMPDLATDLPTEKGACNCQQLIKGHDSTCPWSK